MRIPRDFDPADPNESEFYSFDFKNELQSGEAVSSVAFDLTLSQGVDADPTSRKDGSPVIDGTVVRQRLTNLQAGAVYVLRALVNSSAGNELSLWSHIKCNKIA